MGANHVARVRQRDSFAAMARPVVEDVSDIARARRRIARVTLLARIIAWPLLVFAVADIAQGRFEALIVLALSLVLLWAARSSRAGSRAGGAALLVCGALGFLIALIGAVQMEDDLAAAVGGSVFFVILGGAMALGGVETLRAAGRPEVFYGLRLRAATRRLRLRDLRRASVAVRLLASLALAVLAAFAVAVSGIVGGLLLLPAVWLLRQAMAHAAPDAARALQEDASPPVLYLRSFADEELTIRSRWNRRRSLLENLQWPARDRFEEVLVRHLADYGPVIAVGQPGERIPKLGAAREYLPDQEWQHSVLRRMKDACLVAVVLGRTEGLEWEMAALVRTGALARTLLIAPPVDDAQIQARWRTTAMAVERAGGPSLHAELAAEDALRALVVVPAGAGRTICGKRRDEWHYETALHRAASTLVESR